MKNFYLKSILLFLVISFTANVNGQKFVDIYGSSTIFGFNVSYWTTDNYAAFGDYDNDGDLDIITMGGSQSRLYINNGSGSFLD